MKWSSVRRGLDWAAAIASFLTAGALLATSQQLEAVKPAHWWGLLAVPLVLIGGAALDQATRREG